MTKMPDSINICGVPYKVKLCKDNFTADHASHFGEIDYVKSEIRINSETCESMQWKTLVHEWVHGALVLLGYTEECDDEKLVQGLALAISQTFTLGEL